MSEPTYHLRTLGAIALTRCDDASVSLIGQTRPLLLLSLLAQSPRLSGRRDYLAQLLWSEADGTRARRSLRQALFRLTKGAPDLLTRDGEHLTLNRDVIRVDCWDLEGALKRHDYAKVIALYQGPFLAGQTSKVSPELEHWIESQNAHIHQGVELAYTSVVDEAIRGGETEQAVHHAREFAAVNPLDESAQLMLVRSLRAHGDEIAALGAYQSYRTLLDREVGDTPPIEWEERMERVRKEMFAPIVDYVAPALDKRAIVGVEPITRKRFAWLPAFAIALVAAGLLASISLRSRPTGPLADLNGQLVAGVVAGGDTTVTVIDMDGEAVGPAGVPKLRWPAIQSPDLSSYALVEAASDGWNLAIRANEADSAITLTSASEDEFPVAWSPDSRLVLYARRRVHRDGRNYVHDLHVMDVTNGQSRPVARGLNTVSAPSASWSPDGTQIVFTADVEGGSDLFVVDFDAGHLRNITRNNVKDLDPAWSPDRERIAFISRRDGASNIMTMRPDGTDLQQVARMTLPARSPHWLNAAVLIFVVNDGDVGDVWAVDVFSGQTRQLTFRGDVVDVATVITDSRVAWIERLVIIPAPSTTSPGQHVTLDVVAISATGDTSRAPGLPVSWRTSDESVARFTKPGELEVFQAGRFQVAATLAGWRSDTLTIFSRNVSDVSIPPIFVETWESGLRDQTWISFGDPRSEAIVKGGPGGGVFHNRGDAFFESGVVLRDPISLERGATVEVYGQLPFTGQLHQTFGISLMQTLPDDSSEGVSGASIVDFRVQGPTADEPGRAWVTTPTGRTQIPMPDRLERWHRYAIQQHVDGAVAIIIDGRVFWRSPPISEAGMELPDSAYVALGYRSFQTTIAHGPLAVYDQPKYVVESNSGATDAARVP